MIVCVHASHALVSHARARVQVGTKGQEDHACTVRERRDKNHDDSPHFFSPTRAHLNVPCTH